MDHRHVTVDESGLSQRARFSVLLFLFHGTYEDVYLHCRISLCDQDGAPCSPVSELQLVLFYTQEHLFSSSTKHRSVSDSQKCAGRFAEVLGASRRVQSQVLAPWIQKEVLVVLNVSPQVLQAVPEVLEVIKWVAWILIQVLEILKGFS